MTRTPAIVLSALTIALTAPTNTTSASAASCTRDRLRAPGESHMYVEHCPNDKSRPCAGILRDGRGIVVSSKITDHKEGWTRYFDRNGDEFQKGYKRNDFRQLNCRVAETKLIKNQWVTKTFYRLVGR
jgi:hypothetical protein